MGTEHSREGVQGQNALLINCTNLLKWYFECGTFTFNMNIVVLILLLVCVGMNQDIFHIE